MDGIVDRLEIDADDYFKKLGVLSTEETDNELRRLIQCLDFGAFKHF